LEGSVGQLVAADQSRNFLLMTNKKEPVSRELPKFESKDVSRKSISISSSVSQQEFQTSTKNRAFSSLSQLPIKRVNKVHSLDDVWIVMDDDRRVVSELSATSDSDFEAVKSLSSTNLSTSGELDSAEKSLLDFASRISKTCTSSKDNDSRKKNNGSVKEKEDIYQVYKVEKSLSKYPSADISCAGNYSKKPPVQNTGVSYQTCRLLRRSQSDVRTTKELDEIEKRRILFDKEDSFERDESSPVSHKPLHLPKDSVIRRFRQNAPDSSPSSSSRSRDASPKNRDRRAGKLRHRSKDSDPCRRLCSGSNIRIHKGATSLKGLTIGNTSVHCSRMSDVSPTPGVSHRSSSRSRTTGVGARRRRHKIDWSSLGSNSLNSIRPSKLYNQH